MRAPRVGFIGLGAMGMGMARNLHAAGWLSIVWNRTRECASALAEELGVAVADEPAALTRAAECVVTSVSRDVDLAAVVEALLPGVMPGTVVCDTSTVGADTARAWSRRLAERGAHFLDCPVSGGAEGARTGRLAMMVGGEAEVLERVRGPLSAMAATIVHMGPSGSGQATKAVNQIMAAGIAEAVTEALAFGDVMGLPMDRVIEVVSQGAAANWFLSHRGKSMLAGRFAPGFKLSLHHKDLLICREMAAAGGMGLPVVEMTLGDYARLMDEGHGEEDISALIRIKRGPRGPTDLI
ncbi:MAG: NAD(P)-dependent oxidoreductase [Gammaproteobacteria bacterium]